MENDIIDFIKEKRGGIVVKSFNWWSPLRSRVWAFVAMLKGYFFFSEFCQLLLPGFFSKKGKLMDRFDAFLCEELKKECHGHYGNYVNLFGYNLSTALKAVAQTTPSPEFKELLNGMVSTIETGGDLDEYLKGKAIGALNTYRLGRKRYVEALATYSDIYTTILVAAPLLFVVVLAIINAIGGKISGFEIADIAVYGTYGLIPLLNIGYMIFLSISQPEI